MSPPLAARPTHAATLQRLPVRLRQEQGDEQQEDAGRQRVEPDGDGDSQTEAGDDAHRPRGSQQRPQPRVERQAPVERIRRQQVEAHQEEVGRRQHRQRQRQDQVARCRGLRRPASRAPATAPS